MKSRHVPMRTCVICRQKRPKRDLLRVVRTPEGEVVMDPTGRMNGRGGYVCINGDAGTHWGDRQIRARLGHALKSELTQDDIERLRQTAAPARGNV